MRGVSKRISCLQNRTTHLCQTGAFTKCIKKILVHLFKVDAKHSYRRVVHQRVWRFGIGGSRPNGFILTQWLCMLAQWLPVALSAGQIIPQSTIHCCLSICMFFSCPVTWLFSVCYIICHLLSECFREFLVLQMIWCFNIFLQHVSFWCVSFICFCFFLLTSHLIEFADELFQKL